MSGSASADRAGRVAGSLLGLAVGDAVGFVVEAHPPSIAAEYVASVLRRGAAGVQSHPDHPFGQYSDDTQLARELLAAIRDAGGWSAERFAERLAALFAAGGAIGAGDGTRGTALRLLAGVPWTEAAAPAPYAGNGSAMRAGPVGALFADDPERAVAVAAAQSAVTHADPRCAAGAVAVVGAAALAAADLPASEIPRHLGAWVARHDRAFGDRVRALGDWLALDPPAARERLRADGLEPASVAEWRGISAFVVPGVLWSLYAFLRSPDDYWETVCVAIEPGGDTDSLAAMAGSISGSRNGEDGLPPALVAALQDRGRWRAAELARLARDCAAAVEAGGGTG